MRDLAELPYAPAAFGCVYMSGFQLAHNMTQYRIVLDQQQDITIDGMPNMDTELLPGMELKIAGRTLIAEGPREVAFHRYVVRRLGASPDQLRSADLLMHYARLSRTRRVPLVLAGTESPLYLVRAYHRAFAGDGAPFLYANPRRARRGLTGVQYIEDVDQLSSLAKSEATIFMRNKSMPRHFAELAYMQQDPACRCTTVIWRVGAYSQGAYRHMVFDLPAFDASRSDLPTVVRDYAYDAGIVLRLFDERLSDEQTEWVCRTSRDWGDLELATLRMLVLASTGSPAAASTLLGVHEMALRNWLDRRSRDARTWQPIAMPDLRPSQTIALPVEHDSTAQSVSEPEGN